MGLTFSGFIHPFNIQRSIETAFTGNVEKHQIGSDGVGPIETDDRFLGIVGTDARAILGR